MVVNRGNSRLLENDSAWDQQGLQTLKWKFCGDREGEKKLQNGKDAPLFWSFPYSCPCLAISMPESSPIAHLKSLSSQFKAYLASHINLRLKHCLQVEVCLSLWISKFVSDFNTYCLSLCIHFRILFVWLSAADGLRNWIGRVLTAVNHFWESVKAKKFSH